MYEIIASLIPKKLYFSVTLSCYLQKWIWEINIKTFKAGSMLKTKYILDIKEDF